MGTPVSGRFGRHPDSNVLSDLCSRCCYLRQCDREKIDLDYARTPGMYSVCICAY